MSHTARQVLEGSSPVPAFPHVPLAVLDALDPQSWWMLWIHRASGARGKVAAGLPKSWNPQLFEILNFMASPIFC